MCYKKCSVTCFTKRTSAVQVRAVPNFVLEIFALCCCCCCLNSGGIEDPKRVPSLVGRFNHPLKCVCVCVYVSFYVSVLYDNGVVSNSVYLFEV